MFVSFGTPFEREKEKLIEDQTELLISRTEEHHLTYAGRICSHDTAIIQCSLAGTFNDLALESQSEHHKKKIID